jgi:hypothetical protein
LFEVGEGIVAICVVVSFGVWDVVARMWLLTASVQLEIHRSLLFFVSLFLLLAFVATTLRFVARA